MTSGITHRKIFATILLTVFVSMIIFTDFHRHDVVNMLNICENCQHNVPHPHHLSASVSFENLCLLCQWTGNPFEVSNLSQITACLSVIQTLEDNIIIKYSHQSLQKLTNKAPPLS